VNCSAALLQAERQAGMQGLSTGGSNSQAQTACYVIAPERCPYSVPSALHPGAGLALCSSDTNLTYEAAPLPLARSALPPAALAPSGEHRPGELAPDGEHRAAAEMMMPGACSIGPPCTRQCCLQLP